MTSLDEPPTAVITEPSEPTGSSAAVATATEGEVRYIGLMTRGIAFVIDAALISLVAFLVGAAVALIGSLLHFPHHAKTILAVIGGAAYVLWAAGYFVGFWSATGQTPGDRVMQIRVVTARLERVRAIRGIVRCIGLILDGASVHWIPANTLRQEAQGHRRLACADGRNRRARHIGR